MKHILLNFLLFSSFCGWAQLQERIEVKGNILLPAGLEPEGITIFNKTANLGAVSSAKGDFSLKMAAGDTLIFAAVNLKKLELVVDKKTIENKVLYVEITEGVNELPEILLRNHNLTGNVAVDIEKIEVEEIDMAPFRMPNIKDLIVQPDAQTTPGNAAEDWKNSPPSNFDFIKMAAMVKSLLFRNKEKRSKQKEKISSPVFLDRELRARYNDEFFLNTFGVEARDISDFISFSESSGLTAELLKEEKELDLIQFLMVQSVQFRKKN